MVIFTPIIWFVTDHTVEPRLDTWNGVVDAQTRADLDKMEVTPDEQRGLRHAGVVALLLVALFAALAL